MLPDPTAAKAEDDAKPRTIDDKVFKIGVALARLDPGPLAELRRMALDGEDYGAPYFWRLASRYGLYGKHERDWARVIRIIAILTEKGRDEQKRSPHEKQNEENSWRGLGTALCDGGDPGWPPPGSSDPRPVYSEDRLARLLAAKGETRADLMERAARMLSARKPRSAAVDCAQIARFLLHDDEPSHAHDIARDYYTRLDRAVPKKNDDGDSKHGGDDE